MELIGPDGRPLKLPLETRVQSLEQNLQLTFSLMQQLKVEALNQALKVQFLLGELSNKGILEQDLDTKFQSFVKEEFEKLQAEQIQDETESVGEVSL